MEEMNRRSFLRTTGKLALAGATALSIEPILFGFIPDPLKLASASASQTEFNVYNDVNPNAKDIVAHTFKDCLARKWWPGICYKTSKPMVAVAGGTVTDVSNVADTTRCFYRTIIKEQNRPVSEFMSQKLD